MDFIQAIILGIIQGITEWLPISSSGHLVIAEHLLGVSQPIVFKILLHIGSLFVVVIVFWKDIKLLVNGIFEGDKKQLKLLAQLIIASIPIAVIGLLFREQINTIFNDLRTVGFSLLFTAIILFFSKYPKRKIKKLNYKNTFLMGVGQALAILPGVSRSGLTISTGLMQGVNKERATTFAFLMFIPAILGAMIVEFGNLSTISNIPAAIIGTLMAIIVGYFTLKLLVILVKKGKLFYFSIYCVVLGLIILGIFYL